MTNFEFFCIKSDSANVTVGAVTFVDQLHRNTRHFGVLKDHCEVMIMHERISGVSQNILVLQTFACYLD